MGHFHPSGSVFLMLKLCIPLISRCFCLNLFLQKTPALYQYDPKVLEEDIRRSLNSKTELPAKSRTIECKCNLQLKKPLSSVENFILMDQTKISLRRRV